VTAKSTSGQVQIDGMMGSVDATTTSGGLNLSNLSGPVHAQTSSGSMALTNLVGGLSASSASGSVSGTQLRHVQQVQSSSGSISLEAVFADPTRITSTNGSVHVKLLPGTAVQLDVHSVNGSVEPRGALQLNNGVTNHTTLSGAIGAPASDATLSVQTQNGSVVVSQ
jgi:DUF4097 and DUF4098 domain-containing protein YvlB